MHQPQLGRFDSIPNTLNRLDDPELRAIEQSFAYMHASSLIEAHCAVAQAVEDDSITPWYDLRTRDTDLADEVHYLQSRNLLEVHPENHSWVRVCDEGEPVREQVQ